MLRAAAARISSSDPDVMVWLWVSLPSDLNKAAGRTIGWMQVQARSLRQNVRHVRNVQDLVCAVMAAVRHSYIVPSLHKSILNAADIGVAQY